MGNLRKMGYILNNHMVMYNLDNSVNYIKTQFNLIYFHFYLNKE